MQTPEQTRTETGASVPAQEAGPVSPEQIEARVGQTPERPISASEKAPSSTPSAPSTPSTPSAPSTPSKDPYLLRVERVMEEDLLDAYLAMTPAARARFKTKGEATAARIRTLIDRSSLKVKKIIRLIWSWLKSVTGVNRYWLQQEAKIKADKIVLLAEDRRREKEEQV